MSSIQQQLEQSGLKQQPIGKHIVVSKFGGRVLALMPDGKTNLFWINPETLSNFDNMSSRKDWCNLGGERVWISPEVDTNVGDPDDFFGSYSIPPAMDPAAYSLEVQPGGDSAVWSTDMKMTWQRAKQPIALELERHLRVIKDSPVPLADGVQYAGYSLSTTLTMVSGPDEARPGLWHIIQIPKGGTITTKVFPETKPASLIGKAQWTLDGNQLTTHAETKESFKWSIKASESRCLLLYERALDDGQHSLVVRTFPVTNNSDYTDCPAFDFNETGHMCQVYVDDGQMGNFAEMEFHAPALSQNNQGPTSTYCEAHGFIGPKDDIQAISEDLFRQ